MFLDFFIIFNLYPKKAVDESKLKSQFFKGIIWLKELLKRLFAVIGLYLKFSFSFSLFLFF